MYRPSCKRFMLLLTTLAIINGLLWSVLQGGFRQGAALSTLKLQTRRRIGNDEKPIGLDLNGLQGIKRRSSKPETTTMSMLSVVDRAVAEKYLGKYERTPMFSFSGGQDTSGTKHQAVSPDGMHLALAMCGKRLEEVKVLVKSVLLFTRHATFHVFSDTPSQKPLCEHVHKILTDRI
ncbi:uncharacterized protein LOC124262754 [Haliotis rubra]|uniref:uncharacterized protein LOC124262754 n=1 Tax=Haliotis rubra TaxID=36100 RepID=UPI001EE58446|nr:uncharacterized protein LOC124262754 [Haliotis rubra]